MIKFFTRNTGWNPEKHSYFLETDTKVMKFPGGEIHLKGVFNVADEVAVMQGSDGDDLMALLLWADIRRRNHLSRNVVIPYLPAARQDKGVPMSAAVYAKLLNSAKFDRVVCIDPHSDVMPALIDELHIINSYNLTDVVFSMPRKYRGIIAPDSGATRRAYEFGKVLCIPTFQAFKHRDAGTGALTGFGCETLPESDLPFLVVDDICDGGGTFIGLAESLKLPKEKLDLYVTHGVMSAGHERLEKHFQHRIMTDSHPGSQPFATNRIFMASNGYHVRSVINILIKQAMFGHY